MPEARVPIPEDKLPSTMSECIMHWAVKFRGQPVTFRIARDGFVIAEAPDGQYWFVGKSAEEPGELVVMQVL